MRSAVYQPPPECAVSNYTVSQKKIHVTYVFDDNLNSKRPIVIIFGTVIT